MPEKATRCGYLQQAGAPMRPYAAFGVVSCGCACATPVHLPPASEHAEHLELDAGTAVSVFDGGACGLSSADKTPWKDVFASMKPFPADNSLVRVAGLVRKGQVGTLIVTACRGRTEQMSIYVYPADPGACVPFDETVAVEGEVHLPTEEERGMTADGPGFTLRNARFVGVVSHNEVCRRSR